MISTFKYNDKYYHPEENVTNTCKINRSERYKEYKSKNQEEYVLYEISIVKNFREIRLLDKSNVTDMSKILILCYDTFENLDETRCRKKFAEKMKMLFENVNTFADLKSRARKFIQDTQLKKYCQIINKSTNIINFMELLKSSGDNDLFIYQSDYSDTHDDIYREYQRMPYIYGKIDGYLISENITQNYVLGNNEKIKNKYKILTALIELSDKIQRSIQKTKNFIINKLPWIQEFEIANNNNFVILHTIINYFKERPVIIANANELPRHKIMREKMKYADDFMILINKLYYDKYINNNEYKYLVYLITKTICRKCHTSNDFGTEKCKTCNNQLITRRMDQID
jgi:hypothetical protein